MVHDSLRPKLPALGSSPTLSVVFSMRVAPIWKLFFFPSLESLVDFRLWECYHATFANTLMPCHPPIVYYQYIFNRRDSSNNGSKYFPWKHRTLKSQRESILTVNPVRWWFFSFSLSEKYFPFSFRHISFSSRPILFTFLLIFAHSFLV